MNAPHRRFVLLCIALPAGLATACANSVVTPSGGSGGAAGAPSSSSAAATMSSGGGALTMSMASSSGSGGASGSSGSSGAQGCTEDGDCGGGGFCWLDGCARVAAVSAGSPFTCALTTGGAVQCWGSNEGGELGDGSTEDSAVPVAVSGLSSGVAAISAARQFACALTTDGGVVCWGTGVSQLGNGLTDESAVPVTVLGLSSGVVAIAAGGDDLSLGSTCALTMAGGVLCWGDNGSGELGNGSTLDSTAPVAVSGLSSGVTAVAVGDGHACALTTGGEVQCWGSNGWGQLGIGVVDFESHPSPVPVSGLPSGVVAIAAGGDDTCALTATGTVLCWGDGGQYQLGTGSPTNSPMPVVIPGLPSVAEIGVGDAYACARTTAGAVLCWGDGSNGALGDGSTTSTSVPTPVTSLSSGVAAISLAPAHACALTTAGAVLCWGDNSGNQLGIGKTTPPSLVPVAVLEP